MKKRPWLFASISMLIIFALSFMNFGNGKYYGVDLQNEKQVKVVLNGENLEFDQPPLIINGRTMVPVRRILEELGMTVGYVDETRTVYGFKEGTNIRLQIGSNSATVGDKTVLLDQPAMAVNGRTLVPVRFISESAGARVEWDANNYTVYISQAASTPGGSNGMIAVQRLKVEGKDILTPEGKPIELRGLNWGWWGTAEPQDAKAAVEMGANVIRMPIRWYFTGDKSDIRDTGAPGHISPEGLKQLDQYIDWCAEQKLWVVLFGGSDQGAGDNEENYWTNPELRKEFFEMWEFLADRYKDKPYIAAYEILSEPHPKKPSTSKELLEFYEQGIDVIRKHDKVTPLIIGANDHYDINQLEDIYTNKENDIIYTFNYYLPTEYCKPEKQREKGLPLLTYPGTLKSENGEAVSLDKNYLSAILQPAVEFRNKHNVPIFVNQVGVRSEAPGHIQYMNDVLDIFYNNHIPFTYWTYRTRSDATQHGLYWLDEDNVYHPKEEQIEQLENAFKRQ